MPIPRNWSEELVSEWLNISGYSTEIGIPVGTGGRGGRKEADVVGIKISGTNKRARILQIYHVEVGQLRGHENDVAMLKEKFSNTRTDKLVEQFKKRMAFAGDVQYDKVYIDIWERPTWTKRLMSNPDIDREGIKVWTLSELYSNVFAAIKDWGDELTLPESYWMLKMLKSLREARLLEF